MSGSTASRICDEATAVRVRHLGVVEYGEALRRQEAVLQRMVEGATATGEILLLEHEAVYTLGRGADEADLMGAPQRLGVPVFRVGRGGGATFHGPGQIVAYPIVGLPGGARDVHAFIRLLETALIETCAHFGVAARTVAGATGVWTSGGKIGAIGIGVKRGVAFHGVALNVSNDLHYFERIIPCRAPGMAVTTLVRQGARGATVASAGRVLAGALCRAIGLTPVDEQSEEVA